MVNILARIVDSERNFNGSADPMVTADRGFIQIMGPDFGFWLLGSSDRGSQRRPGKLRHCLHGRGFICNRIGFDAVTPFVYTEPAEFVIKTGSF